METVAQLQGAGLNSDRRSYVCVGGGGRVKRRGRAAGAVQLGGGSRQRGRGRALMRGVAGSSAMTNRLSCSDQLVAPLADKDGDGGGGGGGGGDDGDEVVAGWWWRVVGGGGLTCLRP